MKCINCHATKDVSEFNLQLNGEYQKQCKLCIEKKRNYAKKYMEQKKTKLPSPDELRASVNGMKYRIRRMRAEGVSEDIIRPIIDECRRKFYLHLSLTSSYNDIIEIEKQAKIKYLTLLYNATESQRRNPAS